MPPKRCRSLHVPDRRKLLTEEISAPMTNIDKCLSIEALITYLHNAHAYFLDFRLPHIRRKLTDAIADCPKDVAFVITKFFDEYAAEVHKTHVV